MLRKTILNSTTKAGTLDSPFVREILASSLQRRKFIIMDHYHKPQNNLKTDWSFGVCFTLKNIKLTFFMLLLLQSRGRLVC